MIDGFATPAARAPWSVAALVREVGDWLAGRFSVCSVRGEISGFTRAASGHCYFNLKDAEGGGALLRCAMFRRAASLLAFAPREGQLVEVRGRLGVYEARGELQIVVEAMQAAGAGALYEQFLRIKARLEAQGLFDPARKRDLASYPRAVGVVTSLGAAALQDVLTALARRAPHLPIVIYPSAVQGPGAPAALVEAIGLASRRAEVDTLIVCRGGGSLEDLWAFNDEQVVRAIAAASMPVVCGVGHETDVTLADFAADLRAPTPTAAAELAAPTREALSNRLAVYEGIVQRRVHAALDEQAQRLDRIAVRLARPGQVVRAQREQLTVLAHRLDALPLRVAQQQRQHLVQLQAALRRGVERELDRRTQRLAHVEARLRALDRKQVLTRGYAWLSDSEGSPIGSVHELTQGDSLQAVLHDGTAGVIVTELPGRTSA
ncbi:exodeoxyribonuclease VII large subunit [Rhizobacter sp. Root404]|uniref:exodeoxyribonuclease VII large subunit n=1 Tax=Rhizobacter sp. Root404 TaxID=1736528 RepID=UPI001F39D509|nr:exodeoxyribonuclease VII large subunit [Rhizobacter sp. Root404]